ncbi:probable protein phosphatase 2C 51 isoform X7 [Citrus sinensis]|uniref:probable protein phosphatase 2C 51 isoform X7 n=1 Tax=Citrus sinensis TaxID=2711 RepID=UPI002278B4D5|nr:probable protein phosphatase 2C 51 isoform X7 [Citrus sinensis]
MRIYELESHLSVLGFIIVAIVTHAATRSSGESSTCLTVYKEGGAPAVFQSPKCPRWKLSDYNSPPRTTSRCQSAMRQGRRKSQEDRTLCALDLHIPFPGRRGRQEVTVGIVAVFDGHNGAEASELASKLLLEYFALHTYFLLDATYSAVLKKSARRLPNKGERDIVFQVLNWDEKLGRHELKFERFKFSLPDIFDDSFHLEILREALLRAIHDIDTAFSKATSRKKLDSGSTATVVLIAEGQILVANIGDSKALLCSEKFQSPAEAKATLLRLYRKRRDNNAISTSQGYNYLKSTVSNGLAHFTVKELTRDHHPDREDERYRVEAAGGYVLQWGGVSRVNGQLAVSRAIGDLSYKSYGVISVPEVTDWQSLTANDSYLVAASDGVFEKLSLQDVCDVFWEVHTHGTAGPGFPSSCSYSLADCLVDTAFEKGSMDNMAAVVVPLGSIYVSENLHRERRMEEGDIDCPSKGLQKLVYKQSGSGMNMNLLQLKHAHPLTTKFDRLLVEGNHGSFGCFYLSENLNDNVDSTFGAQKDDPEDYVYDLSQTLPDTLNHQYGELLNLYNDQNMCLHFGTTMDGIKDQCFKPGGFASFVGLLESIPFLDVGSEYGSNEYVMPERYVLKKRFGRGSYGEVWLAFHWNCHEGDNSSRWSELTKNVSGESICEDMSIRNPCNSSSTDDFHGGYFHDSLFILKRIMLMALKSCHDRNITHRDIKPENMVICFEDQDTGRCLKGPPSEEKNVTTRMRIIDFGSAIDDFTVKHLYGSTGPSKAEQTSEYTPPEAFLNATWYQGPIGTTLKYDMWSVGVVILEMILGSPNVFQISDLTRALLDHHLEGWNDSLKELAFRLRSYMELCILIPGGSSKLKHTSNQGGLSPASWKCSEEFFSLKIKGRDPLKQGFPNVWALRLVRQLLLWDAEDRLSVDVALRHPYFQPSKR